MFRFNAPFWSKPKLKFITEQTDFMADPGQHPDVAGGSYTETYTEPLSNVSIRRKVEVGECPSGRGAYVQGEDIQFKVESDSWVRCGHESLRRQGAVFDVIERFCQDKMSYVQRRSDVLMKEHKQQRDDAWKVLGNPPNIEEILNEFGHEVTFKTR